MLLHQVVVYVLALVIHMGGAHGSYCYSWDGKPRGLADTAVDYDKLYAVGEEVNCTCDVGWHPEGGDHCLVTCTEEGWAQPDHPCTPAMCPPPPDIENGRVTNSPPGGQWTVLTPAEYNCTEGYRSSLDMAQSHARCDSMAPGSELGEWQQYMIPDCLDCGQPPQVEGADLAKVTSILEHGKAVYNCHGDQMMIGDGASECRYTRSNGRFALEWLFLPECLVKECQMPERPDGPGDEATVGVRRCESVAHSSYPFVTCEPMVEYTLSKGFQEQSILFNGDTVCMIQQSTREVIEEHKFNGGEQEKRVEPDCHTLCLSSVKETGELLVRETVLHNGHSVKTTKLFNRYQLLAKGT